MKTIALSTALLATTCLLANADNHEMSITEKPFGKTKDGKEVTLYTLKNETGMTVSITNYGGIVTSIRGRCAAAPCSASSDRLIPGAIAPPT